MGKVAMIISNNSGMTRREAEKIERALKKAGVLKEEKYVTKEINEVKKKDEPEKHEVKIHDKVRLGDK